MSRLYTSFVSAQVEANFKENEKLGVMFKRGKKRKTVFLPQDLVVNFQQSSLGKWRRVERFENSSGKAPCKDKPFDQR